MKECLLALQNICYAYEDSPFTLRDVSLDIYRGERIAVLGGNGAGKSTFFLLCNGVLPPDSGALFYRGERIDHGKRRSLHRLRQRVGIVFQDPGQQIVGSTVEGEVSFGPMNLRLSRDETAKRVEGSIKAMQLEELRERPPHSLSGGEKKRVTIADVLAMEPELILFDEPTASLDPAGTANLVQVLSALSGQGKTLVLSTHDIDFAWQWADRILVFAEGSLIGDGKPEAVFADSKLLDRTQLRPPCLYAVAARLQEHFSIADRPCPRTLEELERWLERVL